MRITSLVLLLVPVTLAAGQSPQSSVAVAVGEHLAGVRENSEGHLDKAESHYRNAIAIWDQLAPAQPQLQAITLISLADLLAASERLPEAHTLLDRALVIAQPLEQKSPDVVASVISHLGAFYGRTEQPERGRPLLNEAIRRFGELKDPDIAEVAYAYSALGMLDLGAGKYSDGEASLREAVTRAVKALGETHPETIGYQTNLALALYYEGHFNRAEVLLQRARLMADKNTDLLSAAILSELAAVECALGKFGTAENLTEEALVVLSRNHGPHTLEVAALKVSLATLYLREHRVAAAARILPDAVQLERSLAVDPRVRADGIRRLADLRAQQRNWSEAEELYRESISLYRERLGANHPDIAAVLRDYAVAVKHNKGHQS